MANNWDNLPQLATDLDVIQKLDDEPNDVGGLTAAELKAKFDEAGNTIKTYINSILLPAVKTSGEGAEGDTASVEAEVTAIKDGAILDSFSDVETVFSNIKDGATIDSFGDVETVFSGILDGNNIDSFNDVESALDLKVDKPVSPDDPDGTAGQFLMSKGDEGTEWVDFNEDIVENVLAEHPEWTTTVQNGAVTTPKIANGAVTSAKIADGTIATGDLADSAVTTAKVADTSVTRAKLASGVTDELDDLDTRITTVEQSQTSPYNFKGSVATLSNLPSSGNVVNDTYYVEAVKYRVTWTGSAWVQSSMDESDYEDELSAIKSALSYINTDRNGEYISIKTKDYHLVSGSVVDGVIQSSSTQVVTSDFIDCRGVVSLELPYESDKQYYLIWYSEPKDSAYVSRNGWFPQQSQPVKIQPIENFLRIGIKENDGSAISPSFGEITATGVGLYKYQKIIDSFTVPEDFEVLDVGLAYVSGAVDPSNGDNVVSALSRICSSEYIDLTDADALYIKAGTGTKFSAYIFSETGGKALYSSTSYQTELTLPLISGIYNYCKINIAKSDDTYLRDGYGITTVIAKRKAVNAGDYVSTSGVILNNEFCTERNVHITADNPATVIVSNENMLIPDYYETKTSKTTSGITFTVNDDFSITANGTSTGNADFFIRKSGSPTISVDATTPLHFSCLTEPNDNIFAYSNSYGFADHGYGVVIHKTGVSTMFIRIKPGVTVNNLIFKPMLTPGILKKDFVKPYGYVMTNVTDVSVQPLSGGMVLASTGEISISGWKSKSRTEKEKANAIIKANNIAKYQKDHVISVCHRGLLTEAPENTIYAFRAAVDADIEYLESDIQFTSDGVPVMFHDSTINRVVAGHTGKISDYTWSQVQEFDVYSYFEEDHPDKWNPEFENARIISFEEYLQFAKGVGKPSALEIKGVASEANIATVLSLIETYKYGDHIVWMGSASSYVNVLYLINDYPEMVFLLTLENTPTAADYTLLKMFDTGVNVLGIATNRYNEAADDCRNNGYILYAFTVDTLAQAQNIDPYVTMACSNSINIYKVLKDYYMGN